MVMNARPWAANGFIQLSDVQMDNEMEARYNAIVSLQVNAPHRIVLTHPTTQLAPAARETSSFVVPHTYGLVKLQTNYPARVRVYLTAAQRDADLARPVNVAPTGDHGLVLEVVTTPALLVLSLVPVAFGDVPVGGPLLAYLTIDNNDSVSRAITLTLNAIALEA